MPLNQAIARAVLAQEEYDRRFEKFCNELISLVEGGAVVLNTSASWDLGKDGRSLRTDGNIFCCCSLTDGVDEKIVKDLRRLQRFEPKIDRVYFCSSVPISEARRKKIEADVVKLLPTSASIDLFGLHQLSELSVRWPEPVERHYRAEIDDCIRVLEAGDSDSEDTQGLLLALSTVGHENSSKIR